MKYRLHFQNLDVVFWSHVFNVLCRSRLKIYVLEFRFLNWSNPLYLANLPPSSWRAEKESPTLLLTVSEKLNLVRQQYITYLYPGVPQYYRLLCSERSTIHKVSVLMLTPWHSSVPELFLGHEHEKQKKQEE